MLHNSFESDSSANKVIDVYGVPISPNIQRDLNGVISSHSLPYSSVSYSQLQANPWLEHGVSSQLTSRNDCQRPPSLEFTFSSTHPSNPALSGISRAQISSPATPADNYNPFRPFVPNQISCKSQSHSIPAPVASVLNHFKSRPIQYPIPVSTHSYPWSNPSPYTTHPAPSFAAMSTSAIPSPSPAKKQRTRLYEPPKMASTKDFVPPDVTGLSKREARLVKNRAAAFLSRQKKREAYEGMELQVAQLQEENEHLKSLIACNPSAQSLYASHISSTNSPFSPTSELDGRNPDTFAPPNIATLHAQLVASQQREREYISEIQQLKEAFKARSPFLSSKSKRQQQAWNEDVPELELDGNTSSSSSSTSPTPLVRGVSDLTTDGTAASSGKTGAGLGLMALLCALPSILKTTTPSPIQMMQITYNMPNPTTTIPIPFNSPSDDMFPYVSWKDDSLLEAATAANEMDLNLDLDSEYELEHRTGSASSIQKRTALELIVDSDIKEKHRSDMDLGALEISFETEHEEKSDRLRVRIHTTPSKPAGSQLPYPSKFTKMPKTEPHTPVLSSNTLPTSFGRSPLRLFPDYTYDSSFQPYDPNNIDDRERLKNAVLGPFLGACSNTDSSLGLGFESNSNPNDFLPHLSTMPHTSSMSYNSPFNSSASKLISIEDDMDLRIPSNLYDQHLDSSSRKDQTHSITSTNSHKRSKRVRISLKSMPTAGSEGGEWNVDII